MRYKPHSNSQINFLIILSQNTAQANLSLSFIFLSLSFYLKIYSMLFISLFIFVIINVFMCGIFIKVLIINYVTILQRV